MDGRIKAAMVLVFAVIGLGAASATDIALAMIEELPKSACRDFPTERPAVGLYRLGDVVWATLVYEYPGGAGLSAGYLLLSGNELVWNYVADEFQVMGTYSGSALIMASRDSYRKGAVFTLEDGSPKGPLRFPRLEHSNPPGPRDYLDGQVVWASSDSPDDPPYPAFFDPGTDSFIPLVSGADRLTLAQDRDPWRKSLELSEDKTRLLYGAYLVDIPGRRIERKFPALASASFLTDELVLTDLNVLYTVEGEKLDSLSFSCDGRDLTPLVFSQDFRRCLAVMEARDRGPDDPFYLSYFMDSSALADYLSERR